MTEDKMDQLTAFEVSMAEKTAGMSITSLADEAAPKVGLIGALAWVHMKRDDPTLTYKAVMEGHTFDQLSEYLWGADEPAEDEEGAAPFHESGEPDGAEPDGAAGDGEGALLSGYGRPAE